MLILFIFVIPQGITSVSSAIQIDNLLITKKEDFKYLRKSCYDCRNRTGKNLEIKMLTKQFVFLRKV